jgi:ABC-type bacteriocin/lantibiotic exporter with double-glycine peptidase domain
MMQNKVQIAVGSLTQILELNQYLDDVYDIMTAKETEAYKGKKRIDFNGKFRLESVSFQYTDKPFMLKDITMSIECGKTIALVGPNGAGKSTIANIILGFCKPQEGRVHADGYGLEELDMPYLRRKIGVVRQDSLIFTGTILENITYGYPNFKKEEILKIAELATAHDFIKKLPEGYDTFVGEGGLALSGGERQRIAITRSLLRKPALLILDEPTNHLDEASIHKLMVNLQALEQSPAILIITHNTKILPDAQYIYSIKEGRIVAKGDYQTLFGGKSA